MSEFFHQYFDFTIMGDHFSEVLEGFFKNLLLFAVVVVLALAWGLILALLRQAPGKRFLPIRGLTIAYIDVLRAIPLLIIILLISGGIPYLNFLPKDIRIPQWFGEPDPFWYGVLALTLVYGAYMAEVYRAGIEAVPRGQMEAARSLGMSHLQAMRHVVVPQAVTKIPAPMLNEMISLLKDTTLVSVVALGESVLIGREILAETFNSSAVLLAGVMFLVITLPAARLVDLLIKRNQGKITRGAHIEVA
ncbi:MAG TPA: amino acid ABC transporter permease [Solirubrobacterales bacterium]|jgi:polar amino acid transport system permease protein|nr:amino acid ABC transporter permease [Solirubrobacterales bacterium]